MYKDFAVKPFSFIVAGAYCQLFSGLLGTDTENILSSEN